MLAAIAALVLAVGACGGEARRTSTGAVEVGGCHIGGCSGELCSDRDDLVSACMWKPEYACYQTATCEPQEDGRCGWTQTQQLTACLANPPAGTP